MLTHELSNDTMSEAIKWYPQLKDAFKYLVPVGVAANVTHPYVETEYLLPTFDQCPFLFLQFRNDVTDRRSSRHKWYDDARANRCSLDDDDEFICTSDPLELLWLVHLAVSDYQRGGTLVWCFGRPSCVGRPRGYGETDGIDPGTSLLFLHADASHDANGLFFLSRVFSRFNSLRRLFCPSLAHPGNDEQVDSFDSFYAVPNYTHRRCFLPGYRSFFFVTWDWNGIPGFMECCAWGVFTGLTVHYNCVVWYNVFTGGCRRRAVLCG